MIMANMHELNDNHGCAQNKDNSFVCLSWLGGDQEKRNGYWRQKSIKVMKIIESNIAATN